MQVGTNEHDEAMKNFEKIFSHLRLDKEPRELWPQGQVYQNGETNTLFLAFHHGVEYGKVVYR